MITVTSLFQTIILCFLPSLQLNNSQFASQPTLSPPVLQFGMAKAHTLHPGHHTAFCSSSLLKPEYKNISIDKNFPINASFSFEQLGKIETIVIDPGHGGHDSGCRGGNSMEKHLALAVAHKLANFIQEKYPEMNVIMTREKDVFIPLYERARIANKADADLFISIHCNYFPVGSFVRGSETYVMGLHTAEHNLDVAKRENDAILLEDNYEKNYDYNPNSAEGHIMLSMFQNAYLEQSILFAELVESSFHENAKRKSRGVKQAGFVVLKETTMPSVLIETGFLSNYREEQFLKTNAGQLAIAQAIAIAFDQYKGMVENELNGQILAQQEQDHPIKKQDIVMVAVEEQPLPDRQEAIEEAPTIKSTTIKSGQPIRVPQNMKPKPQFVKKTERSTVPPKVSNKNGEISEKELQKIVEKSSGEDTYQFFIQLAASNTPLNTKKGMWANVPYQIEIEVDGDSYKYRARNFETLEKAVEGRSLLRHLGFTDAFIIAYRNGEKISLNEFESE